MNSAVGLHLLAELRVPPRLSARLNDRSWLLGRLRECVARAGFLVVGEAVHAFEPQGITACLLLAESHLTIHSWPETGVAALDLYVCNHTRDNSECAREAFAWLCDQFDTPDVEVRSVPRGVARFEQATT